MDPIYSLKLPPESYRRTIEELSVTIPDPVLKLKFLKRAINEYQKISSQGNLKPPIAGIAFQKKLLDNAEELWPGSKKAAKNLIRKDVITAPDIKSRWVSKFRYVIGSAILMFFIWGVGTAVSPLVRSFNLGTRINLDSQQAETTNPKIIVRKPILYFQPSNDADHATSSLVRPAKHQNEPEQVPEFLQNPILAALTASPQNRKAASDRISKRSFLSSRPPESEKHLHSSIARPAKHQNEPEQVPEFLQNPILAALTASPQNQNAASYRISPEVVFILSAA